MKVLCVQFDVAWEDREASFARARALLDAPAGAEASLVALPEMFSTGFSMDVPAIAEAPGGSAERFLAELAGASGAAVLGGVVTPAGDGRGRNEAVLVSAAGETLARYAKMHPFTYAGEAEHYAPGAAPVVVEVAGTYVAPFVCYDLRFPEVFRGAVLAGAEVLVLIANWPEARHGHWRTLLRARAIENQAYVVGVNRTGSDPNATYAGGSVVVDPRGAILAEAGSEACVLAADLDLDSLRAYRQEFPAIQDIRPGWVRRP